jgi:hypothetical protein
MTKIQTKNGWSCLPCAFAAAIGIPVEEFIEDIGHDGGAEPYPGYPTVKAGFHEQECIDVVQRRGFAATLIEIVPQITPFPTGPVRQIWFSERPGLSDEDCNWERFTTHLHGTRGVLTGAKRLGSQTSIGHAVAWVDGQVIDSKGNGYVYNLEDADDFGFKPRSYWKIQEVNNG